MIRLFRVRGHSMMPDYRDGDLVLVLNRRWSRDIKPGDDIIADHAEFGMVLKRVTHIAQQIKLAGLSSLSTTPEHLTLSSRDQVRGRVLWHLSSRSAVPEPA